LKVALAGLGLLLGMYLRLLRRYLEHGEVVAYEKRPDESKKDGLAY
jgi:hypothetical protein